MTFRDLADVDAMLESARRHRNGSRDRRRPPGPGGRECAGSPRHGRDRRAPVRHSDGAAARCGGGRAAAAHRWKARGIEVPHAGEDDRHPGRRTRHAACASTTAASSPPTSSSWRPASGPTSSSRRGAGLRCERGILVDDTLQTFDPGIYAVGECVQHRNRTFGLVAPLWEQARVCAIHLAEVGVSPLPRHVAGDAAQGRRHRVVFGRRLRALGAVPRRWCCRIIATGSTSAW